MDLVYFCAINFWGIPQALSSFFGWVVWEQGEFGESVYLTVCSMSTFERKLFDMLAMVLQVADAYRTHASIQPDDQYLAAFFATNIRLMISDLTKGYTRREDVLYVLSYTNLTPGGRPTMMSRTGVPISTDTSSDAEGQAGQCSRPTRHVHTRCSVVMDDICLSQDLAPTLLTPTKGTERCDSRSERSQASYSQSRRSTEADSHRMLHEQAVRDALKRAHHCITASRGCYPEPSSNPGPAQVPALETLRAALQRQEPVDLLNRQVVTQITGDLLGFERVVMKRAQEACTTELPANFVITAMHAQILPGIHAQS